VKLNLLKSKRNRKIKTIVLAGNPNTGKTSLFNRLCGTHQRVGNYPGVTVERKKGYTYYNDQKIRVVDIPGTYSLKADSPDEALANETLSGRSKDIGAPDALVFVLDGLNIKRNLFLYSQIAQLQKPTVVALTMTDLLADNHIEIDVELLSEKLGVPVVSIIPNDSDSLDKLKKAVVDIIDSPKLPLLPDLYPEKLNSLIAELANEFVEDNISFYDAENLLFRPECQISKSMEQNISSKAHIEEYRKRAIDNNLIMKNLVISNRYKWAENIVKNCEKRGFIGEESFSNKIDKFLTHRFFGLLFFALIMFLIFFSVYAWASPLMDIVEMAFGKLAEYSSEILSENEILSSLLGDGIIAGVGSVVIFLPQIVILFALVTLLEDSGYLARAAFLMDKVLSPSGLSGRSFIPMLSSFACAIPGIMASRVIPDNRTRVLTILITPLMSCSARLPIYVLMIGAFIEPQYGALVAGFTLFFMHIIGLLIALPLAFIFNRKLIKSPVLPFVLEMPPYRMPHWRNVVMRSYTAGKKFLIQVGSVVFVASIVIWAMSYFPRPESVATQITEQFNVAAENEKNLSQAEIESAKDKAISAAYLEQSYLGTIGKAIAPVFAPLGFDWKISVSILAAFPARELIVATLGILYQADEEDSVLLSQRLMQSTNPDGTNVFRPLVAISLMVFFALCAQCFSTLATAKRELNSSKMAVFMFAYMTALAYIVSLIIYQIGVLLGY